MMRRRRDLERRIDARRQLLGLACAFAPFCSRCGLEAVVRGRAPELVEELGERELVAVIEIARRPLRSFAGYANGFSVVQTKARKGASFSRGISARVMTSSTMPGSSRPVLLPSTCSEKYGRLKSSSCLLSRPTSQTFLFGVCCRWVSQPIISWPSRP